MTLIVNNIAYELVMITNTIDGEKVGMYLVPTDIDLTRFEVEIASVEDQDVFDESNDLGALRIFATDLYTELRF